MTSSVFGDNALRASATELVLPLLKPPVEIIEQGHAADWAAFIALAAAHPVVATACRATSLQLQQSDVRYTTHYSAANANNNFSNRFDEKVYGNLVELIKAREEATKARAEHDAIMATRPPPTPPPEEFAHDGDDNGDGGGGYDEEGQDGGDGYDDDDDGAGAGGGAAVAEYTAPPRPRKTRAQRREEEQQKKDDAKRQYEVEVKEHAVACLEQRLENVLRAIALRFSLAP